MCGRGHASRCLYRLRLTSDLWPFWFESIFDWSVVDPLLLLPPPPLNILVTFDPLTLWPSDPLTPAPWETRHASRPVYRSPLQHAKLSLCYLLLYVWNIASNNLPFIKKKKRQCVRYAILIRYTVCETVSNAVLPYTISMSSVVVVVFLVHIDGSGVVCFWVVGRLGSECGCRWIVHSLLLLFTIFSDICM